MTSDAKPEGAAAQSEKLMNAGRGLETVMRIPVSLKILLGSVTMPIAQLAKLGRGAIIPLDRRVGEPVDVVVNGRTVAKGEIVVIDEVNSRFGISLTQIVDDPQRSAAE